MARREMRKPTKLLTAVAGMILPVVAIAGPARADEPAAATCTVTPSDDGWTTTQCSDSPTDARLSRTWTLSWLSNVQNVAKGCADIAGATYRLENTELSPGRIVPRGVQVLEPGGVGVTGLPDFDDYMVGSGVTAMSMANWTLEDKSVQIVLHCTSDPTRWYH